MEKTTVYGLPLNPTHLLGQLKGASFCVSYATRKKLGKQLNQAIELLGQDSILLVDNGAFSHFMSGGAMTQDYIEGYETWANEILDRCPQAVAVIPDVIGGTVEQNAELINTTMLDTDRAMPIWHLAEPLSYLRWMLDSGFNYIGFGSSGEYCGKNVGTAKWHARIKEAMDMIDAWEIEGNECRPRIHMMLAQSQAHLHNFDSADSTNVARNHNRYRKTHGITENHVAQFAARIDATIQASAGAAAEHQVKRPLNQHQDKDVDLLQLYFLMDQGFSEEGAREFIADCAGDLNVDVDELSIDTDDELELQLAA